MATSGDTAFSQTATQIVTRAMRILGVLESNETPTGDDMNAGIEALNGIVKALEADGVNIWRETEDTLTLTASQASYTFGSGGDKTYRPLRITTCRSKVSASANEVPCQLISLQEYRNGLVNKTATGLPTLYAYDAQLGTGTLYLWPTPASSSYSIAFSYARPFEVFTTGTDEPDFPTEWFNALTYNLAVDIAPEHGKVLVPAVQNSDGIAGKAERYLASARGWDRDPGPLEIVPDEMWIR